MIRRVVSANAMFVVGSTAAAAFGIGHMKSRRRERTQGEADSERGDVVHPLSNAFLREWRNWRTAGAVVFAKEADDMVVSVRTPRGTRTGTIDSAEEYVSTPSKSAESGIQVHGPAVGEDAVKDEEEQEEEEEEETTCAFCLFQRRGPCGQQFRSWERCIARAKKDDVDFVSRCAPNTRVLMSCMDEHPEYYTIKDDGDDGEGAAESGAEDAGKA